MVNKNVRFVLSIIINLVIVTAAVAVIYSIGMKGFNFGVAVFNEKSVDTVENAREVEVTLPVNITDSRVVDLLYEKGLVEDKLVFRVQVMLSEYRGKFKEGTYILSTSMKPTEIMKELSKQQDEDAD